MIYSTGVFCPIPTKFSWPPLCNAWKRELSRKTAINFPFDDRLGPVFFSLNENDKNYAMGGEFSWFDLPIKLQKNKEASRTWTVQWYGFRFYRRISFIGSETYGVDRTRSLAFSYFLVSIEHDLAHGGFLSSFQQNFPGLLVCNARKQEQSQNGHKFCIQRPIGASFSLLERKRQELCRGRLI